MSEPICWRCGNPGPTETFGDAMTVIHGGGQQWCERCIVEVQVDHALERQRELARLEKRLRALGGRAPLVICGPVMYQIEGDTTPFGTICGRRKDHVGPHRAIKRASP